MINYLTTKNRLLVAMLAFILPFSFAKAEVKEDGKTISQGWYVGIEGGMPFGFSTFSSFGRTHLYRIFKTKEGCSPTEWRDFQSTYSAQNDSN